MRTASMPGSRMMSSAAPATFGMPQRCATSSAALRLMSAIACKEACGRPKAMVSACTLPIRPAPITPTLSFLGIVFLNGPEILAIPPGALFGCAHSRQNILLHQRVAIVAGRLQPSQDGRKIHAAFAEFAEHAMTEGFEIIPAFYACLRRDLGLAVLEMDVPDTVFEPVESVNHVSAARSVGIVAGIEHKAEERGVGQFEQLRDFFRCFDIAGAMVMKDSAQAGFVLHRSCKPVGAFRESFPFLGAQAHAARDPAGVLCPRRVRAVVVGQHQERPGLRPDGCQETCGLECVRNAGLVTCLVLERN